jgi:hypothetical protein
VFAIGRLKVSLELVTGVTFEWRAVGVMNNGEVNANRAGAVAWNERVHVARGSERGRIERARDITRVMGGDDIVRRLGCMMKRSDLGDGCWVYM